MKGRSLEDINVMFEEHVPIRKFGNFKLEHPTVKTDGPHEQGDEKTAIQTVDEDKENL